MKPTPEARKKLRLWHERQEREKEALKQRLAERYKVPRDALFDKTWDLAWNFGHANGLSEVEIYFDNLAVFLTDRQEP